MDIPNLSTQPISPVTSQPNKTLLPIVIIIVVSLSIGFWLSRFYPINKQISLAPKNQGSVVNSTDSISQVSDLKAGTVYGNKDSSCKDTATGTVEKGNINGEGTHILNRPGGTDQRASLTSSTVDLDLFISKKVEITGQTNSSKKTGWLLDVCSIKIVE